LQFQSVEVDFLLALMFMIAPYCHPCELFQSYFLVISRLILSSLAGSKTEVLLTIFQSNNRISRQNKNKIFQKYKNSSYVILIMVKIKQ